MSEGRLMGFHFQVLNLQFRFSDFAFRISTYWSLTSRRVPTRSLIYVEEGKGIVKRISFPPK